MIGWVRAVVVAALAGVLMVACGGDSSTGACVSDPVSFSAGLRVYCYSGWDRSDCTSHDANQVNGAGWTFHSGQSCEDRGLTDGSNPWP